MTHGGWYAIREGRLAAWVVVWFLYKLALAYAHKKIHDLVRLIDTIIFILFLPVIKIDFITAQSLKGSTPTLMFIIIGNGARGVMVIVIGNGHGDTSSNPRRDWLHFT